MLSTQHGNLGTNRYWENFHTTPIEEVDREEKNKMSGKKSNQAYRPMPSPDRRPSMLSRFDDLLKTGNLTQSGTHTLNKLDISSSAKKRLSAMFQHKSLAMKLSHSQTMAITPSSRINAIIKAKYNPNDEHLVQRRIAKGNIPRKLEQKQISIISDSVITKDLSVDNTPVASGSYTPRAASCICSEPSVIKKRSLSLGFVLNESDTTLISCLQKRLDIFKKKCESNNKENNFVNWKEASIPSHPILKNYTINRSLKLEVIGMGLRGKGNLQKDLEKDKLLANLLATNTELIYQIALKNVISWHPRIKSLDEKAKGLGMNNNTLHSSLRKNNRRLEQLLIKILKNKSLTLSNGIYSEKIRIGLLSKLEEIAKAESNSLDQLRENVLKLIEQSLSTQKTDCSLLPLQELQEEELPPVSAPYLPPQREGEKKITLVLDLDETLVHCDTFEGEESVLIRPGAEEFLSTVGKSFEVVIFTASMKQYADWVLDNINEGRFITHRLYREHVLTSNDNCIKDLSLLGRDLSRTIIVDNLAECFRKQPKNGILVRTWTGDPDDTVLSCLSKLLMNIANQRGDILPYLPNVRDRMLGLIK